MEKVLTLILGGGRGTRLYPLTMRQSEPAVPLAGKYKLIDVPISNCINSGLKQVYVLTQYLSVSLHRHIASTYKIDPFNQGFIEVLAAQQTNETADWYQGTADALRQNLRYINDLGAQDTLVLSGDQIYRMDLQALIRSHRRHRAEVTMAVTPVGRDRTSHLGIVKLDDQIHIQKLVEKPLDEAQLASLRTSQNWLAQHHIQAPGREYLANMGIYVFNSAALLRLLEKHPNATDLVREILMPNLVDHAIQGYLFNGYWEDLGTIKSYHDAHLAMAGDNPPFDFHSPDGVIFTKMRNLPASRIQASRVDQSLIADGCEVGPNSLLEHSILGIRSRIGAGVCLRRTVVMGSDLEETQAQRSENRILGRPDIGIGEGSIIEGAILDKDCRIGKNVRIVNRNRVQNGDGKYHVIRDGIVVIPNGMIVPDSQVIE